MSTTALTLITTAFQLLNVFQPGDPIPADAAQTGLTLLNGMMGTLRLSSQASPSRVREVFPLVSGKGGPSNPYTIGPSGDFNTTRPTNQSAITDVAIVLGGTTPAVEVKRSVFTDEAYAAVTIKEQQNAIYTGAFYNPTFASGLGSFQLWPVPNTTLNSFVLYRRLPLTSFVSINAAYDLPDGYDELIWSNLAIRLSVPFGRDVPPSVAGIAASTLATMKATNLKMADLPIDPMLTAIDSTNRRGSYNIDTGQGG